MKSNAPFILLLLAASLPVRASGEPAVSVTATATAAAATQSVLAAESRIAAAIVANDVEAVGGLLAEGYTFTLPDGKIVSRTQYLADMRAWWHPLAVDNFDQQVRLLAGEAVAVINGKARYRWQSKDKPAEEAVEQSQTPMCAGRAHVGSGRLRTLPACRGVAPEVGRIPATALARTRSGGGAGSA